MTTKVIIKSPANNHKDVYVQIYDPTTGENRKYGSGQSGRVPQGEEREFFVYDNHALKITEVDLVPEQDSV